MLGPSKICLRPLKIHMVKAPGSQTQNMYQEAWVYNLKQMYFTVDLKPKSKVIRLTALNSSNDVDTEWIMINKTIPDNYH